MLALTQDLVRWADSVSGAREGRVRVGMIDVAAVAHFTDVVALFRAERPDVDLTLRVAPSADLLAGLRDGELDLVVCVEPPGAWPGLEVDPLLRERLAVMAPPGVTIGRPAGWGPWVTFPSGSHTRQLALAALARLGAPAVIAAESHQPDVLVQMVRLGLGWTVLPTDVPAPGGSGASPAVVVGPEVAERDIVLARRVGSIHDPAADELARRLRASAAARADGPRPAQERGKAARVRLAP